MKFIKNSAIILLLILVITIPLINTYISAVEPDTGNSVPGLPRIVKEKENWCWAACAEMMGKYFNKNSTINQWSIVRTVIGDEKNCNYYPDRGCSITEWRQACDYAAQRAKTFSAKNMVFSWDEITNYIDQGKPIGAMLEYDYSSIFLTTDYHGVIIYSYTFERMGSKHYVHYVDPDDGYSYKQLYYGFCEQKPEKWAYVKTVYPN